MDAGRVRYLVKDRGGSEVLELRGEAPARWLARVVRGTVERLYLAVTATEVIADNRPSLGRRREPPGDQDPGGFPLSARYRVGTGPAPACVALSALRATCY